MPSLQKALTLVWRPKIVQELRGFSRKAPQGRLL